jgi:hypothetical protein
MSRRDFIDAHAGRCRRIGFVGIRGINDVIRVLAVGAGLGCGMSEQAGRFGFDWWRR